MCTEYSVHKSAQVMGRCGTELLQGSGQFPSYGGKVAISSKAPHVLFAKPDLAALRQIGLESGVLPAVYRSKRKMMLSVPDLHDAQVSKRNSSNKHKLIPVPTSIHGTSRVRNRRPHGYEYGNISTTCRARQRVSGEQRASRSSQLHQMGLYGSPLAYLPPQGFQTAQ